MINEIENKSTVLYPGVRLHLERKKSYKMDAETNHRRQTDSNPPLIIWNHRWEFDKQPKLFFNVLRSVKEKGARFSLALLGENFHKAPKLFLNAQEEFGSEIVRYGYAEDRKEYMKWLSRGNIVISTSKQENFGISVIEAINCGCYPLLPNKLSYPELIPEQFHDSCLYNGIDELVNKLYRLLLHQSVKAPDQLIDHAAGFAWKNRREAFDSFLSGNIDSRTAR